MISLCKNKDSTEIIEELCKLGIEYKIEDDYIITRYPSSLKNSSNTIIRQARGLIIDRITNKIVCHSLEGSISYNDFKDIYKWDSNIAIEYCYDGVLINVFYNRDKWNISTKYCIDADNSRFRSKKSFGELFREVVDITEKELYTSYSYSFLLQHKEYRNVEDIKDNRIIHLETINVKTGQKLYTEIEGINHPEIIYLSGVFNKMNFKSYEDVLVYSMNLPWYCPGLMIYSADRKHRCRLVNPTFIQIEEIFKGQTDIRYAIVKNIQEEQNDKELITSLYYPEYIGIISELRIKYNILIDQVWKIMTYNSKDKPYTRSAYTLVKHIRQNYSDTIYTKQELNEIVKRLTTAKLYRYLI